MSQFSFIKLVLTASPVVQLVMAVLIMASVLSWALILKKNHTMIRTKRGIAAFERRFNEGADLSELYWRLIKDTDRQGLPRIFAAGFGEYLRCRGMQASTWHQMQRIERAMRVAEARELEVLEQGLPLLATIGSISPYVGLFGTVWGIMGTFHALSTASQNTLAQVAPGIAEALIATALGLFAAIPAVAAYNRFAAEADRLTGRFRGFSEELLNALDRMSAEGQQPRPAGNRAG
jgi:biopolymer transport protein TolQ